MSLYFCQGIWRLPLESPVGDGYYLYFDGQEFVYLMIDMDWLQDESYYIEHPSRLMPEFCLETLEMAMEKYCKPES